MKEITSERLNKFKRVVACRQPDLTVVLENVHDPHNIGAVLRTCDSVGIKEIFVLYTEPQLTEDRFKMGKKTSAGARKWVDVHLYRNAEACFRHIKKKYQRVLSTHLSEDAKNLYELDLSASVALLFGNEHEGVSQEALRYSDGNFVIPQMGMVRSLNISVACAVTLYEASRQRRVKGYYGNHPGWPESQRAALLEDYLERHYQKKQNKFPRQGDRESD